MFHSLVHGLTTLLVGIFVAVGTASFGQSAAPPASTGKPLMVSLADVIRDLPDYIKPGKEMAYSQALENAAPQQRDAVVPALMRWVNDDRSQVRGNALILLGLLYLPSETSRVSNCSRHLPVDDLPSVAAHLKDADSRVRNATFIALGSVETCGHGMDVLTSLVVPMLHDPDSLTEYPDPFFVEADRRMLATMSPQQQAEYKSQHGPVFKLPAEGPVLLSILAAATRKPSAEVDDAIVAFLDRPDQTKSTIGDCLHTLALSYASERVNNEALTQVFERKAMTVYLLQFVTWLRLTPNQLAEQQERLVALSIDVLAHPELRKAAVAVAGCWNGERGGRCQPDTKELTEEGQRSPQPQ